MRRKERIIHFLLCAYPLTWRQEYGEELTSLLALRPLGMRVISDVAVNALRQRLKRDPPWRIGGVALFLWTLFCLARNTLTPLSPVAYSHITWVFNLMSLVIGCWTMLREPAGLRRAARASLKSALLGVSPEFMSALLWLIGVLHPTVLATHGSPQMHGSGIVLLFVRTDATISAPGYLFILLSVTAVQSLFFGYLGAVSGRLLASIKSGWAENG
jgi:hypothetical protein